METELGVTLLNRGRYGAVVTPVGDRVVRHSRQVLQLLQEIEKEASLEKGLQGGQVRVGCFRSVATRVLPGIIAQFNKRFPKITVSLSEQSDFPGVEQSLREGRVDIGFTYLPTSGEFEAWEILRDQYIALLPPSSKIGSATITWTELAEYPLILGTCVSTCDRRIRDYLRASEFSFKVAYEVNEDSTIVSMVEQGLGATILPQLAAEPLPAKVRVYSLPTPFERVIGVAVLADALHTPAVYAFLDILRGTDVFTKIKSAV